MPTLQIWIVASRKYKSLIWNRELDFERVGMKDSSSESSIASKNDTEMKMLRIVIPYYSGILSDPYDEHLLLSLDGNVLHIRELWKI